MQRRKKKGRRKSVQEKCVGGLETKKGKLSAWINRAHTNEQPNKAIE